MARFTMKDLTPEELAKTRKLGAECKAKGCRCIRRCWGHFGKFWIMKAEVCTHPNYDASDEDGGAK